MRFMTIDMQSGQARMTSALRIRGKAGCARVVSALKLCILALAVQMLYVMPSLAQEPGSTGNYALQTWIEFILSPQDFSNLSPEQLEGQLDVLSVALAADPQSVGDALEAEIGGRAALRMYIHAMLALGRSLDLAEQAARVLHAGRMNQPFSQALNTVQYQDGSSWFPLAEQAGFFFGGLAAVFDGKVLEGSKLPPGLASLQGDKVEQGRMHLAERLDITAPTEREMAVDWLSRELTRSSKGLSRPAAQWFSKGLRAAYR